MAGVDWFWQGVSPLLADGHLGRLDQAFAVLAEAPPGEVVPPQRQALQNLAHLYGADILRLTAGTSVSPDLVLAVIAVESAGRSQAVSHAGAAGLMQLMPATAARFGVRDRLEPAESIRGGVAYLDWLLNHFKNDPVLALAAYNAGEGAVANNGGVPPYAETRAYVPKVLATWAVAQDLCRRPGDAAADRCKFMVAGL
jgi:soluble lytic murein transglycosylase-like protein